MNNPRLLLDMDGVLVDLLTHLLQVSNLTEEQAYKEMIKERPEANPSLCVYLIKKHLLSEPFIHAKPTANFSFFKSLISELQRNDDEVAILSSGTSQPEYDEIVRQKKIWLKNNLEDMDAYFSAGAKFKQEYANKNTILIDDNPTTVREFCSKGGIGIYYPNHSYDTLLRLMDILKYYYPYLKHTSWS